MPVTPETKVSCSRTVRQPFLRHGGIFLPVFAPCGEGRERESGGKDLRILKSLPRPVWPPSQHSPPAHPQFTPHPSSKHSNITSRALTGITFFLKRETEGPEGEIPTVTLTVYFRGSKSRRVAMTCLPTLHILPVLECFEEVTGRSRGGPPFSSGSQRCMMRCPMPEVDA